MAEETHSRGLTTSTRGRVWWETSSVVWNHMQGRMQVRALVGLKVFQKGSAETCTGRACAYWGCICGLRDHDPPLHLTPRQPCIIGHLICRAPSATGVQVSSYHPDPGAIVLSYRRALVGCAYECRRWRARTWKEWYRDRIRNAMSVWDTLDTSRNHANANTSLHHGAPAVMPVACPSSSLPC